MASQLFRKKSISTILKDAEAGLLDSHGGSLKKVLGVKDLTALGIAAVIGAGVFSSIGNACYDGGPGVIFLYMFTAIACGFAALCYAEFASTVPVSGSAYTYSYVAFGEIFAWIIGWDLLMEYAIGNIAVAISWSNYFTRLMKGFGWQIPQWLTTDFSTAHEGFKEVTAQVASGTLMKNVDPNLVEQFKAWSLAPDIFGLHFIINLPAALITLVITYVVFKGIKESRSATNFMVGIKLVVIFVVIVLGGYYVNPTNWSPFTPNGIGGILKGVSAVFFAYIGFDAISTTAEECKDAQRDLPKGMIYSLIICTILYVLLALVLTGVVNYKMLKVGDPLAMIFDAKGNHWVAGIIAVSAVIATASVLLVFQLGQPRIWMSMSRDGLLPKIFSRIHPKYGTPSFSTILTGLVVGIPAMLVSYDIVIALTSIGTLFAFVLVCGGVILLQNSKDKPESKFKVPYINSRYILLFLVVLGIFISLKYNKESVHEFFQNKLLTESTNVYDKVVKEDSLKVKLNTRDMDSVKLKTSIQNLDPTGYNQYNSNLKMYLDNVGSTQYRSMIRKARISDKYIYYLGVDAFIRNIPQWLFLLVTSIIVFYSVKNKFSLLPILGLLSCFYLMAQENYTNWLRFVIWLIVGLVVYFCYGRYHSKLIEVGKTTPTSILE